MSLELVYLLKSVAIGLAAGLLAGGFGIGGGVVATPLTRLALDLSPHVAIGTSLALIIPTAISGALNYLRKNMVSIDLARACAPAGVLGTIAGSVATIFINGHVLMLLVAAIILLTGLDFLFGFGRKFISTAGATAGGAAGQASPLPDNGGQAMVSVKFRSAFILGLSVGFMSGLVGVGGGFVMVPAFCYMYRTPIKVAFGTSLLVVAAIGIPGTIVHALSGHVNMPLVLLMIVGSLPGAWLGSSIALKVKDSWLKMGFGAIMVALACTFAYQEFEELLSGQ